MIVPVVLSGGTGTRLWPLSNVQRPKQFLPLVSDYTLLQETIRRLDNMDVDCCPPLIVCNEAHRAIIQQQLIAIDCEAAELICEPEGRNTAPAVAAAALLAKQRYPGERIDLIVLPADQSIKNTQQLSSAVVAALFASKAGALVTFGISPNRPDTGYGYIKKGIQQGEFYSVDFFVEKPGIKRATSYLKSGDYLWNSGIFIFDADIYLTELKNFSPKILKSTRLAVDGAKIFSDGILLDRKTFVSCPSDSIDYAVMEHTSKAVVMPLDAGWNDVGSWDRLHELNEHDKAGNSLVGNVLALDCQDNYLRSNNRFVAGIGLSNLIVVDSPGGLLVASRSKAQEVAKITSELDTIDTSSNKPTCLLDETASYQVIRLQLVAGANITLEDAKDSLEKARCIVVLKGEAHIVVGLDTIPVIAGKSFEVPSDTVINKIINPDNKISTTLMAIHID
ncbi:MAG: mannose-1-phosphate guanylyltransferase/mannose-6-phosphate isomerase [Legionellales bacterium]|nr:mannose-1-phosphate guanylyltransferase/mannose-6-phosphate isomerase [Legionellales bacterium]